MILIFIYACVLLLWMLIMHLIMLFSPHARSIVFPAFDFYFAKLSPVCGIAWENYTNWHFLPCGARLFLWESQPSRFLLYSRSSFSSKFLAVLCAGYLWVGLACGIQLCILSSLVSSFKSLIIDCNLMFIFFKPNYIISIIN